MYGKPFGLEEGSRRSHRLQREGGAAPSHHPSPPRPKAKIMTSLLACLNCQLKSSSKKKISKHIFCPNFAIGTPEFKLPLPKVNEQRKPNVQGTSKVADQNGNFKGNMPGPTQPEPKTNPSPSTPNVGNAPQCNHQSLANLWLILAQRPNWNNTWLDFAKEFSCKWPWNERKIGVPNTSHPWGNFQKPEDMPPVVLGTSKMVPHSTRHPPSPLNAEIRLFDTQRGQLNQNCCLRQERKRGQGHLLQHVSEELRYVGWWVVAQTGKWSPIKHRKTWNSFSLPSTQTKKPDPKNTRPSKTKLRKPEEALPSTTARSAGRQGKNIFRRKSQFQTKNE